MTDTQVGVQQFPSPFEVEAPPGCEGWESMFPYYALFSEERRAAEEQRGWFRDGMHFPEPMFPFDFVTADSPYMSLGQANSRIFLVPPALGIDHRVLYGWVYMSPNGVADEAEIGRRAEEFQQRAGYYFQNWNELYGRWQKKVEEAIREVEALEVPDLPREEPLAVVTEGRGVGSTHTLLVAYDRLLESIDRIWQYHFEFLNLGYAAYLAFYQLCKEAFPDIADQTIAQMVSGIDVVLFRPDEELKRLARSAIGMGIGNEVKGAAGDEDALRAALSGSAEGRDWLADWEGTKAPWFNYSNGNGFYHHHRSWIDDPAIPLSAVRSYIERLEAGDDIARPLEAVSAERDRVAAEHRDLLPDDATRAAFDESLGLSRVVFPYVESHNFYVEHWYHTLFWNKVREFGDLLVRHGFIAERDDIFYLQRHEISDALVDLRLAWAAGSEARGPGYWPPVVARRKEIMEAMRRWSPPPALGAVPEAITEPMTIMLWGITTERVQEWAAGAGSGASLTGFAGSPGVVEGVARVVLDVRDVGNLEEGEILVAPVTSPSWTPVFGKVAAAVSDIGGIMSHAAIVAREYGMPAVVGTGNATARIATGDRIRVDGNAGVVTILR